MAAIPAPPRENQPFDPNVQLWPDVRFKGYPSQNFDSPRIPLTKPDPRFTRDSELNPLVNRVPTKVAPREIKPAPKISEADLFQDFRFKGYPNVGNDFVSPRIPLTKPATEPSTMRVDKPPSPKQQSSDLSPQNMSGSAPTGHAYNMSDHQDRPRRRIDEYFPDEVSPRFTEKKVKEREDINEFLKQKQFEREMKEREKKREQREAFKMLQESNEFGKPGAGAPNHLNDHRKQKFTEEDLSKRRTPPRYPDQFDQEMARQRVDSRNRDTYRFPPNEKEIYARQIEADVQNRTLRDQTKKIDEMKGDLEMLKNETGYRGPSPYRAGPDSFAQMQSQSFGEKVWEDMAPRRTGPATQYQDDFYNLGQPAPRRKNNWEQPRIYHPFGKPGAGAPLKDVEGNIITGRRGQMAHMYTREELRQKKRAADELHLELQRGAEEQKRNREAEASFRKAPIGEFASLIEDGKVGKPVRDPNTGSIIGKSIPISDVSQMRMNMHPANHDQKVALHNYLTKQSEYNNREKHLQRLKDNQLSRKHHETMDNSWGRAGGGAPKGPHLQKFNLENSLYQWDSLKPGDRTSREAAPQEYIRSKDWSHINDDQQNGYDDKQKLYDQIMVSEQQGISHEHRPPIFARTTVPSTHANQYEYPEAGLKKNYVLDVPFATQYGRTTY